MPALLDVAPEHAAVAAALAEGLVRVERVFEDQLRSDLPPVEDLCRHVERFRGKMLRPSMVLLSGMAAAASQDDHLAAVAESHFIVGAVAEMIHVATLVHDDVLDEAEVRRRGRTVNSLRGNEIAVILGDYLIARSFHLCSKLDSQATALLIGGVTSRVCEGELLQLHRRDDHSLDEATYFEIIRRKTASLIGVCCELGAAYAGAAEPLQRGFRSYGENLGVAFQIRDDLLDITGEESVVGKSLGKDLEKGKLTLPVIHHLATASPRDRGQTLLLIERAAEAPHETQRGVVDALRATGSIEYAFDAARSLVDGAKQALDPAAGGPAKALMLSLADAVLTREH